ncbi:hypothetical protein C6501_17005 [Candidatus Poribacteria bacterium]|nr:MAG: hypothetical protein C6501_17005 [Candidatus Poribacteria bacterium]
MTLEEHIDDIRNQLKQGAYPNEAAVSLGIVLRLLQALEWPIFKPQVVIPEYAVEREKVDFALCSSEEPLVFIEVKQVRNLDGAEKQLFKYASHKEVPVAILTDGWEWHFFSSDDHGEYKELCKLDLIENDSEECAKRLDRYLNYKEVKTKKIDEVIKEDYKHNSNSLKKDPDWKFTAIARRRWWHKRPTKEKVAKKLDISENKLEEAIKNPKYNDAISTELRIYGEKATTDWLKDRAKSPTSVIAERMWICDERAEKILQEVFPNILNRGSDNKS